MAGCVDTTMAKVAAEYEERVETDIANLVSIIEPTLVAVLSGVVSQYALRQSLSGCMLCAAGTLGVMEGLNILNGLINDLAALGPLILLGLKEFGASVLCAPLIYLLFYKLYRLAGGKPV